MPPTTVPGVQRVTVSRTAEVAMVRTSASAPWISADQCFRRRRVWWVVSACLRQHGAGRCTRALMRHASAAGGGGVGCVRWGCSTAASRCLAPSLHAEPNPLVVGRWRMRRRRASSTSAKRRRRPSRRLLTRPSRSRPAPTTRELCHGRTQGRGAACSGGCLSRRFAAALTPRAPPLDSTTKNIQTQGNGFGTFLQKFQTVTPIRRGVGGNTN